MGESHLDDGFILDLFLLKSPAKNKKELLIKGKRVRAIIDTGGSHSAVSKTISEELRLDQVGFLTGTGIHGTVRQNKQMQFIVAAKSPSFSQIWQQPVYGEETEIAIFPGQDKPTYDVRLGRDILRKMKLILGPKCHWKVKLYK